MLKIENKADIFHYRTLLFVLSLSMITLLSRYFYLQVVEYDRYFSKSQVNSVKAQATYAPRGLILDRNGVVLVENYPTYILTVTPYELEDKESQFEIIADITGISIEELSVRYKKYYQGKFLPTIIAKNLTFAEISQIEERRLELAGFQYKRFDERLYSDVLKDAHFLGYLRELDRQSLSLLDKSQLYRAGELIGWQGIEKQYEKELRYSKGIEYIEVDTYGREINRINNNNIPAFPGKNLILSIDSSLQQFSKNLLTDQKGVILVSNVNNGDILSMVSNPSYSLDIYRGETTDSEWNALLSDVNKPIINRNIAGLYPPGSSFKIITAFNLIEDGLLDPEDSLMCTGSYTPPGSSNTFNCWKEDGHGLVNLNKAIAQSCNVYFYETVQLIKLAEWTKTAKIFGFQNKTEIDLPNELVGQIPDKKFFINTYGRWGWSERGVLLNLTLGQGDILVTPLQTLRYINHIASKGRTAKLRLNAKKEIEYYENISLSEQSWDRVIKGLYDVVNTEGGSGWRAKQPEVKLYGKTSTAENPHGEPHAWFNGFFDFKGQTYSLVVLIENGGGGGAVASPIAGEIVKFFTNENVEIVNK
ncbi:MAG: penicillin-binding protein 2 [Candidatus Neomarinimicrobiota bacterium]